MHPLKKKKKKKKKNKPGEFTEPGKAVVASLNDTQKKKRETAMSDLKPPFVFHNYPLLRLLKLIATSPLINSYPTQMQKSSEEQHSLFFMFFSVCPHL